MARAQETDRRQTTDRVLLVSPDHFGFNPQTFVDNKFQKQLDLSPEQIREQARVEYDAMVKALEGSGIQTIMTPAPIADEPTYDEIFANNVYIFDTKPDGTPVMVLCPVKRINRRKERQTEVVLEALKPLGINYEILDLTRFEQEGIDGRALEGTGAIVMDRIKRVAFATVSPRMDPDVFRVFCKEMGYQPVIFHALGAQGEMLYHTNVGMSIGRRFSVVCLDAIPDHKERSRVEGTLEDLGKNIITITREQMAQYAGNVLEIGTTPANRRILMSTAAHDAFTPNQLDLLTHFAPPLVVDIKVIETIGGGSARCTFCEIFPPSV